MSRSHGARILVFAALLTPGLLAQKPDAPARSVLDPGVITTRQQVTPAGVQTVFAGRAYGVAFGKTDSDIFVSGTTSKRPLFQINWPNNRIDHIFTDDARAGIQGVAWDAAGDRALMTAVKTVRVNGKSLQQTLLLEAAGGALKQVGGPLGSFAAGGLSIAASKRRGVVALTFDNAVAVVNLATGVDSPH
jgi:hypothetical protein